ncbi:MAG: NAD(P)/FAD-dependent oxidoreductase [Frankiaceae bacterium]
MTDTYDAIVVGARCAGAATAMLLARRGYRVLLVDHATFPSDTLSTHVIHAPGVAALRRWGLLDTVVATGCPPIDKYTFDFGPFTIAGTPHPCEGISTAYAPRRILLDKILVDAAAAAGAEVRERFSVEDVVVADGTVVGIRGRDEHGSTVTEHARLVIGADGRYSHVAKWVGAELYNSKPMLSRAYYTYFSDLPVAGFETVARPDRGWGAAPTNDGLTMVVVGWPYAERDAYRADIEGNFFATLELAPEFAARVRAASRAERFAGGSVANFFRGPFGPGWALVGDAGYTKDPITAQGISDAFHDAELCSCAVDEWLSGGRSFDAAMSAYQRSRDTRVLPLYEFTAQLATLEPPPPAVAQVLGAVSGNPGEMDAFVSVVAGTVSPAEFFAPEHVARLVQAAPAFA